MPDELFEALYECWLGRPFELGCTAGLTSSERGRINRAAKELRALEVTGDEVRVKWEAMRQMWPKLTLTPGALVGNWSTIVINPISSVDRWFRSRAS